MFIIIITHHQELYTNIRYVSDLAADDVDHHDQQDMCVIMNSKQ